MSSSSADQAATNLAITVGLQELKEMLKSLGSKISREQRPHDSIGQAQHCYNSFCRLLALTEESLTLQRLASVGLKTTLEELEEKVAFCIALSFYDDGEIVPSQFVQLCQLFGLVPTSVEKIVSKWTRAVDCQLGLINGTFKPTTITQDNGVIYSEDRDR